MPAPAGQGGQSIRVYNKTRQKFVATRTRVADGYFTRLVGLLGTTQRWARPGNGLWIVPSHGIHTLGMMFPIDVIFLDRDYKVVDLQEHVGPFRISKVSFKAQSVLELPVPTISQTLTQVGDELAMMPVAPGEPVDLTEK